MYNFIFQGTGGYFNCKNCCSGGREKEHSGAVKRECAFTLLYCFIFLVCWGVYNNNSCLIMPTGQRCKERTSDEREKTQNIGVEGKKSNLAVHIL